MFHLLPYWDYLFLGFYIIVPNGVPQTSIHVRCSYEWSSFFFFFFLIIKRKLIINKVSFPKIHSLKIRGWMIVYVQKIVWDKIYNLYKFLPTPQHRRKDSLTFFLEENCRKKDVCFFQAKKTILNQVSREAIRVVSS